MNMAANRIALPTVNCIRGYIESQIGVFLLWVIRVHQNMSVQVKNLSASR